MKTTTKGKLIASAVAGMFATAIPLLAHAGDDAAKKEAPKVKCEGANSCKGHGSCKSANNACAGKNGCAGKGVVMVTSEKECKDKGGKVVAEKPAEKPVK